MSHTANALPSTLGGIKRLSKTLKRELGIALHEAQELAAKQAGYQNFRHAQHQLADQVPAPSSRPIYLTAYWANRSGGGRETLKIQLPKPLAEIITRYQVSNARNLLGFRLEADDHMERRVDLKDQNDAHEALFAAARTLRFMAATRLRPATSRTQEPPKRMFEKLPGIDHPSSWWDAETGSWVFMDEPYGKPALEQRSAWASAMGVQMITPEWEGIYYPGSAIPFLFCANQALADCLTKQLQELQRSLSNPVWDGESAHYYSHFVSPARQATGKARRSRPMPALRGVERDGALPYGAARGGETSLWRPAKRMPLELHLKIGPLLHALNNSALPHSQQAVISNIRSTLDDWLQMEYRTEAEMSSDQFHEAYYGTHREPIAEPRRQLEAVRQAIALLQRGYAECKPRRQVLMRLGSVESAITESVGV